MNYIGSGYFWNHHPPKNKTNIEGVCRNVRSLVENFRLVQDDLQDVFYAFSAPEVIPSECDQAGKLIKGMQRSANLLAHFLSHSDRLPDTIAPDRYELLFRLCALDRMVKQTLPLLRSFRSGCLEPSGRTTRLQQNILKYLGGIIETGQKIELASEVILPAETQLQD